MKKFLSILLAVAMMMSFMAVSATMANADSIVYDFEDKTTPSNFTGLYSPTIAPAEGQGKDGTVAFAYTSSAASRGLVISDLPANCIGISFWAVATENININVRAVQASSYTNIANEQVSVTTTAQEFTCDFSEAGAYIPRFLLQGGNSNSPTVYYDNITILCEGDIVEQETTTTTTTTTAPKTTSPVHTVETDLPLASNAVLTPWMHIESRYPNNTSYAGSVELFEGAANFGEGATYSSFDTNGYTRTDLAFDVSVDTTKNISDYQGYTYFVYIEKLYDTVAAADLTTVTMRTYFKQNGKATGNNNTANVKVGQLVQIFVPWSSVSLSDTDAADALNVYPVQAVYTNAVQVKFSVSDFYLYNSGEAAFSSVDSKYVGGAQAVAWTDGTNLYGAGDTFTPDASKHSAYYVVSGDIATQEGAGVRWASKDSERGIRFENYVSKPLLDTLGSDSFTIGTLIAPAASVTADNFTHENIADLKAVDVVDPKTYGTTSDEANYRYYGAVVDFEKYFGTTTLNDARTLELAARGYVTVTYADGESATFYSDFNAEDHVRSASDVANAALKDTAANYNDQQIAILEAYCLVEDDTTKAYRTDAADFIS